MLILFLTTGVFFNLDYTGCL